MNGELVLLSSTKTHAPPRDIVISICSWLLPWPKWELEAFVVCAGPMFWPVNVVDAGVNRSKELRAADASLASFFTNFNTTARYYLYY